jgi:ABC-type polysaccharide/polyol phosphate transport system ATPase subunit
LRNGTISVEGLWKRFRADQRDSLLSHEMQWLLRRLRNSEGDDPFRWALRDINLHVEPGESVALVGHNGSGKTTLLKILTKVMYPYCGELSVVGSIGALIEVTGGIHPDLSGRENIYLYGSMLGLPRKQVAARFDEIVDFSELENAIDRQVKFYSWGMRMRLGFSIAAFLEPDVLLVDEVLAVGDSRFQQKCLSRMRQVLTMGSTIVFVSHDLAAVEAICSRGVLLSEGVIKTDGDLRTTLTAYRAEIEQFSEDEIIDTSVRIQHGAVHAGDGGPVQTDAPATIELVVNSDVTTEAEIYVGVSEGPSMPIFLVRKPLSLRPGDTKVSCSLGRVPLPKGEYALWGGVLGPDGNDLLPWQAVTRFAIEGPLLSATPRGILRLAPLHIDADWSTDT